MTGRQPTSISSERPSSSQIAEKLLAINSPRPSQRSEFFALAFRQGDWRHPLLRRALAVADGLAGLVAIVWLGSFGGQTDAALWMAICLPAWLVLAKLHGLYDRDQRSLRHLTVDELPNIFMWSLTATAAVSGLLLLTPVGSLEMKAALGVWLISAGAAFLLRAATRLAWRKLTPPDRTLIIGTGPLADATRRKLELFSDIHVDVVGESSDFTRADLERSSEWLDSLDRVILATQSIDEQLIAELVSLCRRERLKLSVVPPARGMFGTAVQLNHVADLPVVEYNTWDVPRSTLFLKRCIDLVAALVTLALLLPLLIFLALATRLDSRGPIFFRQRRAGKDGRPFLMYKFRTMVPDAEKRLAELVSLDSLRDPMFKFARDPRVTRIGRLLRRWSLDELPQLLNVVKGDMSLVGPRPEQVELVERYRPEHRFRLDVKPGVTGPMQVFGRGRLTFEERLAVEREYVENVSLGRDLRILAMTASAVFSGKGAF